MTQTVTIPGQGDADFPDSMTPDQIKAVIRKKFPVLDEKAKKAVPGSEGAKVGAYKETPILDRLKAIPETVAAAGQGTLASLAGHATALVSPAAGQKVEQAMAPTPSPAAQANLDTVAGAADALKVPDVWPAAGPLAAAREEIPAAARQAAPLAERLHPNLEGIQRPEPVPAMAGVGAAQTDAARMRRERAAALPVPVQLTKGQAERTFEQHQFERETAKDADVGKPLRERFADQNQKILQNFDTWVDQTGAQAGSLRATGEAVDKAVVAKAQSAKGRINAAYDQARKSGDMAQMVDAAPLQKYLAEHEPEAVNAGVIQAAKMKLDKLSKGGQISVNDLEEVRKMVGNLGGKDATNAHFAGEIKSTIDALTEGKGGEAYKRARSLRAQYAKEFENVGVVDKLLSKKPGTSDRAVAYEDVFQHSVLSGSLDDVRAIRKTLQTGGEQGQQAWRELQGATINHLKDEITKNVSRNERGDPIVSPARLNTLVTALDKDGKLDVIFGKKGAQQVRDVRDLALDVYTSPPGSVNTSNTSSALVRLLDKVAGAPYVGAPAKWVSKGIKTSETKKKVGAALADPEQPMLLKDYIGNETPPQEPLKKAVGE